MTIAGDHSPSSSAWRIWAHRSRCPQRSRHNPSPTSGAYPAGRAAMPHPPTVEHAWPCPDSGPLGPYLWNTCRSRTIPIRSSESVSMRKVRTQQLRGVLCKPAPTRGSGSSLRTWNTPPAVSVFALTHHRATNALAPAWHQRNRSKARHSAPCASPRASWPTHRRRSSHALAFG